MIELIQINVGLAPGDGLNLLFEDRSVELHVVALMEPGLYRLTDKALIDGAYRTVATFVKESALSEPGSGPTTRDLDHDATELCDAIERLIEGDKLP